MKTPTRARHAALALLGVFVALLVTVSRTHPASSGLTVVAPTITAAPANPSTSTDATLVFTGPAGAAFRCARDTTTFTSCVSPVRFRGLSQGGHTFSVKAVIGAAESPAAAFGWVVDTIAPPAPVLTTKPANPTTTATNTIAWTSAEEAVTFQCSVEHGAWTTCTTPFSWVIGTANNQQHQFAVRAVDAAGNVSASASHTFTYQKVLPASGPPFTVAGSVSGLTPGLWRPITVRVTNPNRMALRVTGLTVTVAPDSTPPGCLAATNLELQQSNVSASVVLSVPAGSTVTLPAQGATTPRLRLRDLPTVNQDACKHTSFALTYSGTGSN